MPIQLQVTPVKAEMLSGESLNVDVKISNSGAAPVEAPDPDWPTVFEFQLRSAADPQVSFTLQNQNATALALNEPLPTPEVHNRTLDPGGSLTYRDDIGRFANFAIPPDRYQLSVGYAAPEGYLTSPPVPLTIVPPQVSDLAVAVCPLGSNQVLAHVNASGTVSLFQRASIAQAFDERVWQRRLELGKADHFGGVAAAYALEADPLLQGVWWFAWLQDGALGAGLGQLHNLFLTVGPRALGLGGARLYPVGWQSSSKVATFVALGTDERGGMALASATVDSSGGVTVSRTGLAIKTAPNQWRVQAHPGEPYWRFDVVTAHTEAGRVRLVRQSVMPALGKADPPVVLMEREATLATIALSPVQGGEPAVVDVLLGPTGDPPQMHVLRLPLDGGEPRMDIAGPFKADAKGKLPGRWTLVSVPPTEPTLLVEFAGSLMARRFSAVGRTVVMASDAANATHLHLELVDDKLWAIWADPVSGIHQVQEP